MISSNAPQQTEDIALSPNSTPDAGAPVEIAPHHVSNGELFGIALLTVFLFSLAITVICYRSKLRARFCRQKSSARSLILHAH